MSAVRASDRGAIRHTIFVGTDEHTAVCEAINALQSADNLYQRNNRLVRALWPEAPAQSAYRPSARIETMPTAAVRELLSELARFISTDETGKECERHVPPWLVPQVEARANWPGIRQLTGVIHETCMRRDGTVLDEPGYDAKTGLLYMPRREAVRIDPFPTRDDALISIGNLLEIVRDFPFANDANRSAWLAALLTPFARFAFNDVTPLFLIDANAAGSGKSTLADVISLIASGEPMPRNVYPQKDEEMRKLITSVALSGTRMVLFDNVAGSIGNAALDAAITGTTWCDRILGKNAITAALPLFTVWYATGNNLDLNGDTHRRVLPIRLVSPTERPEQRNNFAHPNLRRWVTDKRESFVRDVLTILRAYHAAGRVHVAMEPWGSFEEWSKHVRAALIWCGLPDPAQTRRQLASATDPERDLTAQAFAALAAIDVHRTGLTAGQLVERLALDANHAARAAVVQWLGSADSSGMPVARNLGNKLRNARERVVNGLQLLLLDGQRWLVRPSATPGTGGSTRSTSGRSPSSPDLNGSPEQALSFDRGQEREPASHT